MPTISIRRKEISPFSENEKAGKLNCSRETKAMKYGLGPTKLMAAGMITYHSLRSLWMTG